MRLIITRQYKGWEYHRYKWVILNNSARNYQYDSGYSLTLWGAKFAAWKSLRSLRRKPDHVVYEKEIAPTTEKGTE